MDHDRPKGAALNDALDALDRDENEFLNATENAVRRLIERSSRLDATAIMEERSSGDRHYISLRDPSDWTKRFIAIAKYRGQGIPTYRGKPLDSWLSIPIIVKLREVRADFIKARGNMVGSGLIGMLNDNPIVQREFALQLAKSIGSAGKPLTDEAFKALNHMIQQQISSHVAGHTVDQVTQQLSHAVGTAAGHAVLTAFTASLIHALAAATAKTLAKYATATVLKSVTICAGKKLIISTVTKAVVIFIAAHAGISLSGGMLFNLIAPIVIAFAAVEIIEFLKKLAKTIAPQIRNTLGGEVFRSENKSALELIFNEMFKNGAKELCKEIVMDSKFVESAKKAAKRVL